MKNPFFSKTIAYRSQMLASVLASLVCSPLALADNLGQFDARSLALGGTGVASANSANAAAHNPALMATPNNNKRFSVIPFAVKVDLYDKNDFTDKIEDTETAIEELDTLIDGITELNLAKEVTCDPLNNPDAVCFINSDMGATSQKSDEVLDLIDSLNKSAAIANLAAGMAFQFGRSIPVALVLDGSANLQVGLKFANSDFKELRAYNEVMNNGEITGGEFVDLAAEGLVENDNSTLKFTRTTDDTRELKSAVEIIGATNYELGLGFADSFEYMGRDLAVGISPKIVKVEAVKFHQSVDAEDPETDDIFDDNNIVSKTDVNLDLGVAFSPLATQPLQVGVVVKNLFSRTYDLKKSQYELDLENAAANGDTDAQKDLTNFNFDQNLKIEPQVTAGVAYQLKVVNLVADLDLNEAEVLGRSSQNLSLGAEFSLKFIKIQTGYRSVIKGEQDDAVTAGLTLGPLDLAVVAAGDNIGGVVQTSFSF